MQGQQRSISTYSVIVCEAKKFLNTKLDIELYLVIFSVVDEFITKAHGEGGEASRRLIETVFAPLTQRSTILAQFMDAGIAGELAMTTDSFVITPLIFPGGNIGKLAVAGTVNDLAAVGTTPDMLSAAFILEEGFPLAMLKEIVDSFVGAITEAGARLLAADTKVVDKGSGDGVFITTSGVGRLHRNFKPAYNAIMPGDKVIISGGIAQHSAAIIATREHIETEPPIESDCAPLWAMVKTVMDSGAHIKFMRDPTRGGVATVLSEIAEHSHKGIILDETAIPIRKQVRSICALFGYDPLYLASEGRMLFIVDNNDADEVIRLLRTHPYGTEAAIIGTVTSDSGVFLATELGSHRPLLPLEGEQLPRIC